jgi:hypothetical protein
MANIRNIPLSEPMPGKLLTVLVCKLGTGHALSNVPHVINNFTFVTSGRVPCHMKKRGKCAIVEETAMKDMAKKKYSLQ